MTKRSAVVALLNWAGVFIFFPGDNTMAESVYAKYLLKFCGGWECKNEDWISDYCCLSGLIYFFELKNVGCCVLLVLLGHLLLVCL